MIDLPGSGKGGAQVEIFELCPLIDTLYKKRMNSSTVPYSEWIFFIDDCARCRMLNSHIEPDVLLERVFLEAENATKADRIKPIWLPSCVMEGYWRAEAQITIEEDLFDQLFNGRSGYRAQYYLSPEQGEQFNRLLVEGLLPFALLAFAEKPIQAETATIEASLKGSYSKISIKNWSDYGDLHELRTSRWSESNFGSRLLKRSHAQIDLIGTFISSDGSKEWVDEFKKNRAQDIHERGFS